MTVTMDLYQPAQTLEEAWPRLDYSLPLQPVNGQPNPFYVERVDDPLGVMRQKLLLASGSRPPKFYFSGMRGSGKSTELYHLASDPDLQKKYLPLMFTIRDYLSPTNVDADAILLAIGDHLLKEYRQRGARLPESIKRSLEHWRGKVQKEIETRESGRYDGAELGFGTSFFNLGVQLAPKQRVILRQVVEQNELHLVGVINTLLDAFRSQDQRTILLLIDDLDKPEYHRVSDFVSKFRGLFEQLHCAIVYTVSNALFYSEQFDLIREQAVFLPNVRLTQRPVGGFRPQPDSIGYAMMRAFALKRMASNLITPQALEDLVYYSGGVFREMARLTQNAVLRASLREGSQVTSEDVRRAVVDLESEYTPLLSEEDWLVLRRVDVEKSIRLDSRMRRLAQLLVVLEYRDTSQETALQTTWFEVHPVLRRRLLHETQFA